MNYQQHLANSAAIRAEIQRFESVHPNIYSIYELLERVDEPMLQNQIREHVIAIEGEIAKFARLMPPYTSYYDQSCVSSSVQVKYVLILHSDSVSVSVKTGPSVVI